ncbi:hypothetical protein [Gayadomonas joobiniege]|uniref:hypothetical protein n=1 Tax=Gayadomonas joobiniege TaxID=1234606 RepID=UPI00036D8BF4|nr:hypothetical protein [Gayadomonas joobiniege]
MHIDSTLIKTIKGRFQFLTNTSLVWYKSHQIKSTDNRKLERKQIFLEQFSYADATNASFIDCPFDTSKNIELNGEHYGGQGIGTNGGGVRCGNLGEYQIKGIGTNLLVGRNTPKDHAYGGLDLEGAIVETIYTNAINKALPVGAVDVEGLIYTGGNTGYASRDKGTAVPGALLVRKSCIRPAHFVQAHNFQPTDAYKQQYYSDVHRTKTVNQSLKKHFEKDIDYIKFLGQFLSNCANQFAFARVLGIAHGTVSPSNISFDGKWLDVPQASFVGGGLNYNSQIPLYQEPSLVLGIIDELTYTYSKFNKTGLNAQPLVNYYQSQLDAYYSHYLAVYLGLPLDIDKAEIKADWAILVEFISLFIVKKTIIYEQKYARQCQAPMHRLILLLFKSLFNKTIALVELQAEFSMQNTSQVNSVIDAFFHIYQHAFKLQTGALEYKHFITASLIKAIKLSGFIRFFNQDNGIAQHAMQLANDIEIDQINRLICDYKQAADWIFDYSANTPICVFHSHSIEIIYDQKDGLFKVHQLDDEASFYNINDFMLWLDAVDNQQLSLWGYSFKEDLLDLAIVCATTDQHQGYVNG